MKIFLIGKNGQLGREIDKLSRKLKNDTFSFGQSDLDILDYNLVREKIDKIMPDVVINTAAYHVVSDCEKFPDKAFLINVLAQKNLADICREKKIKLIYYSTDKVFNGKKRRPYREIDPTSPIQIYGLSKVAGEMVTLNYNENSLVIRTSIIFGGVIGSKEKKGNFVLYILKQSKAQESIEISSEQITSFVNAGDLALATLKLLKKDRRGIYNVVNEKYSSSATFAKEIVKLRNLKLKIVPVNRKGFYGEMQTPIFTPLDTSKLKSEGIVLPEWRNGLKRYLKLLESNGI